MTSLNFMLSRTAGRELRSRATRSWSPRLTTTAAWRRGWSWRTTRTCVVQHIELRARHHARLRRPRGQALRRARAWWPSPGRRTRSARSSTRRASADGPRGRRAGLDRRRPLRRARADRRARDRLRRAAVLALQVLRPASGHGLRARLGARVLAPLQGAPGADEPAGPAVRDRHAALRAARRVQRDDRLPGRRSAGSTAIVPYERALGERFLDGDLRRGHGLRAAGDGGPRADVPDQRRGRPRADVAARLAEQGIGVWAHDSLVLAEPLQAARLRAGRDPRSASSTTTPPRRSTGWWRRSRARGASALATRRSASSSTRPRRRASRPERAAPDKARSRRPEIEYVGAGPRWRRSRTSCPDLGRRDPRPPLRARRRRRRGAVDPRRRLGDLRSGQPRRDVPDARQRVGLRGVRDPLPAGARAPVPGAARGLLGRACSGWPSAPARSR